VNLLKAMAINTVLVHNAITQEINFHDKGHHYIRLQPPLGDYNLADHGSMKQMCQQVEEWLGRTEIRAEVERAAALLSGRDARVWQNWVEPPPHTT
jgi:hypothetical protein